VAGLDIADVSTIMQVNLSGPFLVTQAALPGLRPGERTRPLRNHDQRHRAEPHQDRDGDPHQRSQRRVRAGRSGPVGAGHQEPGNLVSTPLYVCDEGSSFLTGQTIVVDGGSAKH
jgi:NAD(P)-dependent dehydrogenase (short-subunit alcohol dehydrogenase family)